MHARVALAFAFALALTGVSLAACTGDEGALEGTPRREAGASPGGEAPRGSTTDPAGGSSDGDAGVAASCESGPAFLHGDVWPLWWNYRVSCDRERKALWRCEKGGGACEAEKGAVAGCNVCDQRDGICIPRSRKGEKDGCCAEGACCDYDGKAPPDEPTHFFGYYRMCRTDCDSRDYDYDAMEGSFYGKGWSMLGQWHLDLLERGTDTPIAFAKDGVRVEYKDGDGYVAAGGGQGFDKALGYFGCFELPVGKPVTVRVGLHDWSGKPKDEPGGIVAIELDPRPGHHYVIGATGQIEDVTRWDHGACVGPPSKIADRLGGLSCASAP